MKRMKKMYSIKETTVKIIKQEANKIAMPESYALDNIVEEWKRLKDSKHRNESKDHEQVDPQEQAKLNNIIEGLREKWTKK